MAEIEGEAQPITLFVGCVPLRQRFTYKSCRCASRFLFVFPALRWNPGFVSSPSSFIKAEYYAPSRNDTYYDRSQ